MSINKKADFIKNYDEELSSGAYEQKFLASNIKYDAINDNNNNNYNLNIVNFNSLTSTGISPNTLQAWHQAYIEIPMDVTVELSIDTIVDKAKTTEAEIKANLTFDLEDADYAISIKSNVHLFDLPTVKWSDVVITNNTNYNNFYRSLEMLTWDEEKLKIHGPLMNVRLDNGESIKLVKGVGEVNGKIRTKLTADLMTNPSEMSRSLNMAQYERCRYLNYKISNNDNYNLELLNNIDTRRIGGLNLTDSTDTKLVYNWITRTPLCAIHDFFDKIPTTGAVSNFDLKFNLNCGPSSTWRVKYKATVGAGKAITKIELVSIDNSAMGNAHTCPFLLSELGLGTGLNLNATNYAKLFTAAGEFTFWVTIKTAIGSNTKSHLPCQLYLPTISYDSSVSKSILSQGPVPIHYSDYLIEELRNSKGTSRETICSINRTFNQTFVKINKLYIIPILSVQNKDLNHVYNVLNTVGTADAPSLVEPYNSPLSSCPNTFNPGIKLYDLQLRVGTVPVYPEPIRSEAEFYNQTALAYFAEKGDANILQSAVNATQLTLDKFRYGYGIYCLDLVHTTDKLAWSAPKTYHISFKYNSPYDLDFIFLFQQEKSLNFDRTMGTIV